MDKSIYLILLAKFKFNVKKAKEYAAIYNKILDLGLFDKEFYLNSYPHVGEANVDPLIHYLFHGHDEGKKPSPYFDIEGYLKKYPQITESNTNPLVYYVKNNHNGFFFAENLVSIKKNKIIDTNSLFLNNYKFDNEPLVSIIILNRNGLGHLKRLFEGFDKKTNYANYEVIVVDNASCDKSVDYLYSIKKEIPLKIIENNENLSFSKANNEAAKVAKGEYLLLLNNDIEPTYGWLNEMVGTMVHNENVGAVGAKLVFPYYSDSENSGKSFSIQHAGVKFREEMTPYVYGPYHEHMFSTLLFLDNVNHTKEVLANTAAAILIPKKIYFDVGGLDEDYFYGYEDTDFAFKIRELGYKSIYCASALLFHHESATRQNDKNVNDLNFKNIMTFVDKWGNKLFKLLLKDKIENSKFSTDKKLQFSIVLNEYFNNNFVYKIAKNLNKKNYNVNLISNMDDIYLGKDCDILVSFDSEYDIEKVIARNNLIKILVLNDNNNLNLINSYDIIFTCDNNLIDDKNEDKVVYIDEFDDLFSDKIIETIETFYLA